MKKCVFLDRDGVLNVDSADYLFKVDKLIIPKGTNEAISQLKQAGFLLIVITNQAGIAKGIYQESDVFAIHHEMQKAFNNQLDDLYFSPHHPDYSSRSLSRKPDSLMLEKAMAKYGVSSRESWMVGDRARDMEAGKRAGLRTVQITNSAPALLADFQAKSLLNAASIILEAPKTA